MLMQCLERPVVCLLTLTCLLGTASLSLAQLTVIFDNGQAKPLSEFLGPLKNAKTEKEPAVVESWSLGAADLETLLPIRSPGLTPGKLRTQRAQCHRRCSAVRPPVFSHRLGSVLEKLACQTPQSTQANGLLSAC